jgi:hypothetical protein
MRRRGGLPSMACTSAGSASNRSCTCRLTFAAYVLQQQEGLESMLGRFEIVHRVFARPPQVAQGLVLHLLCEEVMMSMLWLSMFSSGKEKRRSRGGGLK